MAQTIQIKRSTATAVPGSLAAGELAYSFKADTKKLYIGDGSNVITVGGQAFTDKLDGIAAGANNYTLPQATATVRGGVELFSDTAVIGSVNSVTTEAGRFYGVQLNSNNQMVVNVPWTGGSLTTVLGIGDTVSSSQKIQFNTSNSNNLQISHDAGTGLIREIGTGTLKIQGQDIQIVGDDGNSGVKVLKDGSNSYSNIKLISNSVDVLSALPTGISLENGTRINEFSIDGTLGGNSDDATPTEKAVKTYVDGKFGNFTLSGDTLSTSGSTVTINDAVTISGNLTVQGTTTTVDSTTVVFGDNILRLNKDYTGGTPTADAGLEVERGTVVNAYLVWDESADRWSVATGTVGNPDTINQSTMSPINVENIAINGGTF